VCCCSALPGIVAAIRRGTYALLAVIISILIASLVLPWIAPFLLNSSSAAPRVKELISLFERQVEHPLAGLPGTGLPLGRLTIAAAVLLILGTVPVLYGWSSARPFRDAAQRGS
jgi:multidrug efflux pump subunit AcrB